MPTATTERNLDDLPSFLVSGAAGDYIYRLGDRSWGLFIIRFGEIELTTPNSTGVDRSERLTAGDFFGELSLFDAQPRDGHARALTNYQLLRIDRQSFDRIINEDPRIAVGMLRKLSQRLRRSQQAPVEFMFVELNSGIEFRIPSGTASTIGRRGKSSGPVPDLDLAAVDLENSVSRTHATVFERCGVCSLQTRATVNGTFVNGATTENDAEIPLNDGDHVRFGSVELVLRAMNSSLA